MELDIKMLEVKFKKYYYKKIRTATHVFVYSESQDGIIVGNPLGVHQDDNKKNYVNGVRYTEMRSRDATAEFNWDDTEFIAVGCDADIERR